MATPNYDAFQNALLGERPAGGGPRRGGSGSTAESSSIAEVLDSYPVHIFVSIFFVVGASLLMAEYGYQSTEASGAKEYSSFTDLFFAFGGVSVFINGAFVIAAFLFFLFNKYKFPSSRDDNAHHWLHALSIISAMFAVIWGVLALIVTFGTTLTGTTTDKYEVVGYFMVILSIVFDAYLVSRWVSGFGGRGSVTGTIKGADTKLTADAYLAASRAAGPLVPAANTTAAPSLFGGSLGGAAAFGGLDLSAFGPSSLSAVPQQQQQQPMYMQPPQGAYYGGGMMPGMMYPPPYPPYGAPPMMACGMPPQPADDIRV